MNQDELNPSRARQHYTPPPKPVDWPWIVLCLSLFAYIGVLLAF